MDLFTLRSGEAWFNPFTSLIGLQSLGGTRKLSLSIPVIEEPQAARYSILFHEVTHLWQMRMTSLGVILSIEAARAWNQWNSKPEKPVAINERILFLLGTWLPILEGLATYAELDFSGDEDQDAIHSPVLKVVHFTGPARNGIDNETEFFITRQSRVIEHRLLAQLLLDPPVNASDSAYFSGYLYVKALAAHVTALCPALARPARMLPLLIRILCDHPVIARSLTTKCGTDDILSTIHEAAVSLPPFILNQIANWVEEGDPREVRWRFDFLDLEGSCKARQLVFHEDDRRDLNELISDDLTSAVKLFRSAGSFYLPAWKTGVLQSINERKMILREGAEDVEYVLASAVDFERGRRQAIALNMRDKMLRTLHEAIGRKVTAALYMDLASGDPGMAFWVDNRLAFFSPYSVGPLSRGVDEAIAFSENLSLGLSLAPEVRAQFGASIQSSSVFDSAVADASRWHLGKMVSSPKFRDESYEYKLRAIENDRYREEMYKWCCPQVPVITRMPEFIAGAADRVFDFPGFKGFSHGLRLVDLIPSFPLTNR